MQRAAILHRPESEFATVIGPTQAEIRLRSAKGDLTAVNLIWNDPYLINDASENQHLGMTKVATDADLDYWVVSVTQPTKRLAYGFELTDQQGTRMWYGDQGFHDLDSAYLADGNRYFRLPYFHDIDAHHHPAWVAKTVWYQIFPERFANGDASNDPKGTLAWDSDVAPSRTDFFGGDLQGIIDHLDYLASLGINGVYLTPIFLAPSNHKYDTMDYFEVDPHFGDLTLMKKLVAAAHQRGMKVMLDAVFNHIGDKSVIWQHVIAFGAKSKYADWFHIDRFPVAYTPTGDDEVATELTYDTFAFTPHMPKWNTANPAVQDYLISVGQYWIEECDIDGWRLDVANEVDHHFWRRFREAMLAKKSDLYLLGEIWHSAQPWLDGTQFDGVMNYAAMQLLKDYFVERTISAQALADSMTTQQWQYASPVWPMMFNLLDSHDTPRILSLAQGNQALVAQLLAMMFMQAGTPDIYYGTEMGMLGEADPDNRRPMAWPPDAKKKPFWRFMQQLIKLRRTYSDVLAYGDYDWEPVAGGIKLTRRFTNQKITLIAAVDDLVETNLSADCHILIQHSRNLNRLAPDEFLITLE
jgi:neopullulanase